MAKIVADISMSVDGFVTGPRPSLAEGLGVGGEPIHAWVFAEDPVDTEVLTTSTEATGAVVMGRRLFDIIDGPHGWDDSVGYGAAENQASAGPPIFVVTHNPPSTWRLGPRFAFVDSVASAVAAASAAAGDKEVVIMGGADVVRQAVRDGLADELRLHVSPVLMGDGTALFAATGAEPLPLRQVDVTVSPYATHLTYEVTKP